MTNQPQPTILLVEDSPDDAFIIRKCLQAHMKRSFQLDQVASIGEAESFLKKNRKGVGLILLDLGLPDALDKRDAFMRVKGYALEIPVVILTGTSDYDLALTLVREGAEDFVSKNLLHDKPEMLRDSIEFAISRHRLMSDVIRKAEKTSEEKELLMSWIQGDYSYSHSPGKDK